MSAERRKEINVKNSQKPFALLVGFENLLIIIPDTMCKCVKAECLLIQKVLQSSVQETYRQLLLLLTFAIDHLALQYNSAEHFSSKQYVKCKILVLKLRCSNKNGLNGFLFFLNKSSQPNSQ